MGVSFNVVRVSNGGESRVLERCGEGEQGEQRAVVRRMELCKIYGLSSTEVRIAKEFQDTETLLRDVIRFS